MTVDDEPMRALMAAVELPPSRVDVERAIRTARRIDRRHRVVTAAALTLAVGIASGATALGTRGEPRAGGRPAPRECAGPPVVTTLAEPNLGQYGLTFSGADPTGRHVVGQAYSQTPDRDVVRGVLWVDGEPRVFEVPSLGQNKITHPTDVNGAGVVVGGDLGEVGHGGPWTYRDGQVRRLRTVPGYDVYNDLVVNERGDIAATAGKASGETRDLSVPSVGVLWPAAAPDEPRVLRAPKAVHVNGIAEDGTVVGQVGDDPHRWQTTPYAWTPDGTPHPLAVPPGWASGTAAGVRDGRAVGYLSRRLTPADPAPGGTTRRAEFEYAPAQWPLDGDGAEVGPIITGNSISATDRGWLSVRSFDGNDEVVTLVAPDGTARVLDTPAGTDIRMRAAQWVSEDGRTVLGLGELTTQPHPTNYRPSMWRC